MSEPLTIRPLRNQLVVKRIPRPTTCSHGLLYLPTPQLDDAESQEAVVVAVGPGKRAKKTGERIPLVSNVGDRVLIGSYTVSEVVVDNEELGLVDEESLLAVFT